MLANILINLSPIDYRMIVYNYLGRNGVCWRRNGLVIHIQLFTNRWNFDEIQNQAKIFPLKIRKTQEIDAQEFNSIAIKWIKTVKWLFCRLALCRNLIQIDLSMKFTNTTTLHSPCNYNQHVYLYVYGGGI